MPWFGSGLLLAVGQAGLVEVVMAIVERRLFRPLWIPMLLSLLWVLG